MTGASDPATVAAGLTEAQRRAVLSGGYNDDSSLRGRQRPMLYGLSDMGIFANNRFGNGPWDYALTPLGLAVRHELERNAP